MLRWFWDAWQPDYRRQQVLPLPVVAFEPLPRTHTRINTVLRTADSLTPGVTTTHWVTWDTIVACALSVRMYLLKAPQQLSAGVVVADPGAHTLLGCRPT